MDKATIEKAVDSAFDSCLSEIYPLVSQELYPAAFANEYSWLRVKNVFDLQNSAIRKAVKKLCLIYLQILVDLCRQLVLAAFYFWIMPHHVLQHLWQDCYFLGVTIALQYPNTEISHSLLQRHISSLHLLTPSPPPARPGDFVLPSSRRLW